MSNLSHEQTLYSQPLVSICIPTYNGEKTVVQTMQSILSQTYHNLEILVVDNASTDETLTLLQQFDDPRITIHKNSKNIGAEQNFSQCIHLANGEYIAIFHADDLYAPDMVQKQVEAFEDNPSIGAVFTLAKRINDRGEVIGKGHLPVELRGKGVFYLPEIFLSILRNGNFLTTPSCMVRSRLYKELAPFNVERFATSADLDMWLRLLERCPIAILDERLLCYRASKTQGGYQIRYLRTEQTDFFRVVDYHLSVKSDVVDIPGDALNKYEFQRSIDNIRRAANHLIEGQSMEAEKLLRKSFSATTFRGAIGSLGKPRAVAHWILGILLLILVRLGLGRHLRKSLHWLLYERERKSVRVYQPLGANLNE